jgi:transcriptional regulator with XRE-family HTH domain
VTLDQWLHAEKMTQSDFADRMGVAQSSVARWVAGEKVPRPERIALIETLTGGKVTFRDWMSSPPATAPPVADAAPDSVPAAPDATPSSEATPAAA